MGIKTGNEDFSETGSFEKDSRRTKKREEEARAHHIWYESTGSNVIVRTQIGAVDTPQDSEDPFDVTCDNVAHSLNKGRRWEKAGNAERILQNQSSSGKTSFVKATALKFPNMNLVCNTATKHKDGVQKYMEAEDGKVTVRTAKSNNANLASLQSTAGPGPRLKANRHRNRKEKEAEPLNEAAKYEEHTQYSAIEVQKRTPKSLERSWRTCQHQRSQKQGWTRKPAAQEDDDWNSEEQAALEEALDESYEEQLESEEPLRLPEIKEKIVEKHSVPQVKQDVVEEEVEKVELCQETKKKKQEKLLAKMMEDEYRAQFVELRPFFTTTQPAVLLKARAYFNETKDAECLPVFPSTIVLHKGESEAILGTKMDRCLFIAASDANRDVNLYAAPRFCCTFTTAEPVRGWQSYERTERERIHTISDPIEPSPSLYECPVCRKTEETEELADTVVIEHLNLFSFSCGHVACHSCWVSHAKQNSKDKTASITYISSDCNHISSVTEAAALFSDGTLDIFRSFSWDEMCAQADSVTCHKCTRLLVPDKGNISATALCNCGARTCRKYGKREHLPINCAEYKKWEEKIRPYGPFNCASYYYCRHPYRRLLPKEKDAFINCGQCGAENAWRWKYWCDKCLALRWHGLEYSEFSKEDHLVVLEARGKMMNGDYRQVKIDRLLWNEDKSEHMERVIEEGVCLFELIKISRCVKAARLASGRTRKMALEQYQLESSLESILFAAMESGGDAVKKIEELEKKIEAIREEYAQSITILSL